MRIDASATAITWLPFGALDRMHKIPLELAVAHYDMPPPFPRHSLYAADRRLVDVFGADEFELGDGTPWGDETTPAFAAAVESELERRLATSLLRDGAKLVRRRVARGEMLVEQGQPGRDLFVLLDGVFDVEIDGEVVAQVGSGAILGERAVLGDGHRTATLRAVRSSRVAVIGPGAIGRPELAEISASRARAT
jgi:hypothetical protein